MLINSTKSAIIDADGNTIFELPVLGGESRVISAFVIAEARRRLVIGTSACCFGHLFVLDLVGEDYILSATFSLPTNVSDMLNMPTNYKKTGMNNGSTVLISGTACNATGVFLVNTDYPRVLQLVTEKEWNDLIIQRYDWFVPSIDWEGDVLYLSGNNGRRINLSERLVPYRK